MAIRMAWHGDAAGKILFGWLGLNLGNSMEVAKAEMQRAIGTQGPPRSRPNAPPHVDTRELYDSLFVDVDQAALVGRVGSDVPHAVYTERGTNHVAPRPWFNPSILVSVNKMARELVK